VEPYVQVLKLCWGRRWQSDITLVSKHLIVRLIFNLHTSSSVSYPCYAVFRSHVGRCCQVRLYVDGRLFVADKHNSAIIDDWPLHPTKRAKGSRLVVGACWEGTASPLLIMLLGSRWQSNYCTHTCQFNGYSSRQTQVSHFPNYCRAIQFDCHYI